MIKFYYRDFLIEVGQSVSPQSAPLASSARKLIKPVGRSVIINNSLINQIKMVEPTTAYSGENNGQLEESEQWYTDPNGVPMPRKSFQENQYTME